jgi:putative oxidoreductase
MDILKKLTGIPAVQVSNVFAGLIAIMFFYAAISKLSNFEISKMEMMNQVFPRAVAAQLVWLVPVIELSITFLLVLKSTQLTGLYVSALLMAAFSVYISISMSGAFGRIPCSCGGILRHMSYGTHLVFNLFFLVIAVLGIIIKQRWINHNGFTSKERNTA